MDALEQAKRYLDGYEHYRSLRDTNPDKLKVDPAAYPIVAQAYAAIAQVEQLKRIADVLGLLANKETYEEDADSWREYQEFKRNASQTVADPPSPLDNF